MPVPHYFLRRFYKHSTHGDTVRRPASSTATSLRVTRFHGPANTLT
ncbi:unnamed protein product [Periconia digitata]|uniref:Uncharacterized protein n=1 Tax=Periconia digitata TaxID=1303443 RepID=A0A9W4U6P7_9PLEO|nr:unnamed protein product [Periconia digitata]